MKRAGDRGALDDIERRGEIFHEGVGVAYKVAFATLSQASNALAVEIDANYDEHAVFAAAMAIINLYLDTLYSFESSISAGQLAELNIRSFVNAGQ